MESPANKKLKVLIIANARFNGGASGGDKIYESFIRYWKDVDFDVWESKWCDYKPFALCYAHRICITIFASLFNFRSYDLVYSASDFLPDALGGVILRLKGIKWVAGFYLTAFRQNAIHYYTQKVVRKLIEWLADMVIVTNPTMYCIFPDKKKTWINGGIETKLSGITDDLKLYDAVFCGRIHPSKGIDELIEIWNKVLMKKPDAKLAVIGDGDLGIRYMKDRLWNKSVHYFGYMGDERYRIFKKSKMVLYPTPEKWEHFSMAPVEAMSCGCPMIAFNTSVNQYFCYSLGMVGCILPRSIGEFANTIVETINTGSWKKHSLEAMTWAMQFDYKKQSLRVQKDIIREIYEDTDYRSAGDGWSGALQAA
jgi:glycosyltransferase involved in cell wall biosynthesis